jgi:TctA family transporter
MEARGAFLAARHVSRASVRPGAGTGGDAGLVRLLPAGKGDLEIWREIGSGAIEGVAGPEAANNSAATASLVPLLALGIPFTPIAALMISAMLVQGIQPGPLLITQHPKSSGA